MQCSVFSPLSCCLLKFLYSVSEQQRANSGLEHWQDFQSQMPSLVCLVDLKWYNLEFSHKILCLCVVIIWLKFCSSEIVLLTRELRLESFSTLQTGESLLSPAGLVPYKLLHHKEVTVLFLFLTPWFQWTAGELWHRGEKKSHFTWEIYKVLNSSANISLTIMKTGYNPGNQQYIKRLFN